MRVLADCFPPFFASWLIAAAFLFGGELAEVAAQDDGLKGLLELLSQTEDEQFQLDLLQGVLDALQGRRDLVAPKSWPELYAKLKQSGNPRVRERVLLLALVFRDPQAIGGARQVVLDREQPLPRRRQSLQQMLNAGIPNLAVTAQALLRDPAMRSDALRALASDPQADNARLILDIYPRLTGPEKQVALLTLASRIETAQRLLDGMQQGIIDRRDLSTFTARQINDLPDQGLRKRLLLIWGAVRQPSADSKKRIAEHKRWLTADFLGQADLRHGRELFRQACASCHRLYGQGGQIGPDLTGSNRANLHYVLENVLEPSAAVAKDYQLTTVYTSKGRVISGIAQPQPGGILALQTPTERILLPRAEIEELRESDRSMMPDGLFDKLTQDDIRDLIAYLATTSGT